MFSAKFFIIDSFFIIRRGLVILLNDSIADLYLPGMIDDLPVTVA